MSKVKFLIPLLLALCCAGEGNAKYSLVPAPAQYVEEEGSYTLPSDLKVGVSSGISSWMRDAALEYLGMRGIKASKGKGGVTLSLDTLGNEQYKLRVGKDGILLKASSKAGLFYGVQTLAQMIEQSDGTLEACTINDYPRFNYRGLMLDVVRCYIPVEEIKRFVDAAAELKINNVHLHLTDDNGWRLEIEKYPKLTQVGAWRVDRPEIFPGRINAKSADEPATYGGFYTKKEMKDLVEYASKRNVNIIPEIEMPAHSMGAIASYPELACPVDEKFLGVFPGIGGTDYKYIICAGNENSYKFYQDVIDEVVDIFPSPYIHLGGDEANKEHWEKCPLCNEKMKKEGLENFEQLQGFFMDSINHYLRSKGRTAMGWDEATYGNPKEDMIIYGWQGDGNVAVKDARKSGRRFIMTPAKTLYLIRYQGPQWFEPFTYFGNNTLKDAYEYEPVKSDWTDAMRGQLLGVQGSLWSEFCRTPEDMQYLVFPRLVAVADMAWRPEGSADWGAFMPALDSAVDRLRSKGITVASSMYNLDHSVMPRNDGSVAVELSCIRPDMQIRYSVGDSTRLDRVYSAPLELTSDATVYASTFDSDGNKMGKTLALPIEFNLATGRRVTSPNCQKSLTALTNGLRGSSRISDFEWAGWHNSNAEFILDLGEAKNIQEVILGAIAHSDVCVAAPVAVYLSVSDNGHDYEICDMASVTPQKSFASGPDRFDISLRGKAQPVRYLKVSAVNPGKVPDGMARETTPTWMYFDELIVK